MFVHRVAGPSRLSMPAKLAPPRTRMTVVLKNDGLGCFVMVQRHMARSQKPNWDPREHGKKKEVGDVDAMKKQGKQIAKMGKRGQERKSIDSSVFPTLDVELIEAQKYPRQLYFPYMPPRIRDWPIFARFSGEDVLFAFLTPLVKLVKYHKLPPWTIFRKSFWKRIPSAPARTFRSINELRIATKEVLSIPAPVSSASPEDHPSRSTANVQFISAPGATESSSEPHVQSLKIDLQANTASGGAHILAASVGNPPDLPGVSIVDNTNSSLPSNVNSAVSRVLQRPTIFSKRYWHTFLTLMSQRYHPPKWARRIYMFLRPGYLVVHGFMKKYWTWRYLDPGYWSPQRRQEARAGMKRFRLDLWRDAVKYIQESEKYGKDARDCYMKKLANDRNNWAAMKLVAAHNRFPEHGFFTGLGVRNLDKRWFNPQEREKRVKENDLFADISSPKSPLAHILTAAKDLYVKMNEAVAGGRINDLNQFAAKRYLNEIERRASFISKGREGISQTWKFERWAKKPECISVRAKDFFADYPGAYQGDHLVLNLLIKFDSWQSLTTIKGPEGRHSGRISRKATRVAESKRVIEYIVVDFRTWILEGKPRFIQQIYPDQKLDLITNQITEKKMLQRLKKKEVEEREEYGEDEDRRGKTAALRPST